MQYRGIYSTYQLLTMQLLAESSTMAVINAPIESIDLTQWLFTLKDEEYRACSTAHIAGGSSMSMDGKRMSINVEKIETNLLVQRYIEDISERSKCRVNSISVSISPLGQSTLGITWELSVEKISATRCQLTNHVWVLLTDEFAVLLDQLGITDIQAVGIKMREHLEAHNVEETPGFASDIERKAVSKIWGTI